MGNNNNKMGKKYIIKHCKRLNREVIKSVFGSFPDELKGLSNLV